MLKRSLFLMLGCCAVASALAQQPGLSPATFHTTAQFTRDKDILRFSTVVATYAPPNAAGYSYVIVSFYTFPLTANDIAGVGAGSTEGLDQKRTKTDTTERQRNTSHARLQLMFAKGELSNVGMGVPGLACTIAVAPENVKSVLQEFRFDRMKLRLRGKGTSVCDLSAIRGGKPLLGWDVDVDIPVFATSKR